MYSPCRTVSQLWHLKHQTCHWRSRATKAWPSRNWFPQPAQAPGSAVASPDPRVPPPLFPTGVDASRTGIPTHRWHRAWPTGQWNENCIDPVSLVVRQRRVIVMVSVPSVGLTNALYRTSYFPRWLFLRNKIALLFRDRFLSVSYGDKRYIVWSRDHLSTIADYYCTFLVTEVWLIVKQATGGLREPLRNVT